MITTTVPVLGTSTDAALKIFVGSWDFDSSGFEGTVAEMVSVRGGADPATEEALDSYLKGKFLL